MTIQQFYAAPINTQQAWIRLKGELLLQREGAACNASLYQFEDFYVEVVCQQSFGQTKVIRCMTVVGIEPYLWKVDITPILSLLKESDEGKTFLP
jgi:hypothetical protein